MIKKKLTLEEQVSRFKKINGYSVLGEQAMPEPATGEEELPPAEDPSMDGGLPPEGEGEVLPDDPTALDDPMGDMGGEEMSDTEELDITDLVNLTKSIKNDLDDQKNIQNNDDGITQQILAKLNGFEGVMVSIDRIMNTIDTLGVKMDNIKEPTPVERLEMRSLDSYPFKTKPNEFFNTKQAEMERSGKNEYVLTKQDVQNYSPDQIVKSFNPDNERNNNIY